MKKEIIAMLLAGGVGSRLNVLARHRAKPAIIFGGIYRIIDFTMSNISHSAIDTVGVLTQYKPLSLMEHIDHGRPWDLFGRTRRVEILPPKTGEKNSDWYKGTSDAVFQNLQFINDFSPDLVLIASGDHIYHMNYQDVIAYHKIHKADATICLISVPRHEAHNFGLATLNKQGRITEWVEKPAQPESNLASMGVYLFNRKVLVKALQTASRKNGVDFARHVIPILLKRKRIFGYIFNGYWQDVGTVDTYWRTNIDLLNPSSGLHIEKWHVKTNYAAKGEVGDRPSTYFSKHANVMKSMIGRGCVIEGRVVNSILSPGVVVERNAQVVDSVVFHDAHIGKESHIEKSIIDKSVELEPSVVVGSGKPTPNRKFPEAMHNGITIVGKHARVCTHVTIGKNCIINPDTIVKKNLRSGSTL